MFCKKYLELSPPDLFGSIPMIPSEEAVNEVKRQAMLELQKAVTTAEQKASEMVTIERNKMDRQLSDVKKQTQEEVVASINHQEESSEVSRRMSPLTFINRIFRTATELKYFVIFVHL